MSVVRLNDPLAAYPIGSIYMSVNSTSPQTLFGGTWERITGRFLLAATDGGATGTNVLSNASVAPGASGGEASHKLTAAESGVPAHPHSHTIKATTPKFVHTIGQPAFSLPNHVHSDSHTHGTGDSAQTNFAITHPGTNGGFTRHTVASGSGAANMVRSIGAIGRAAGTAGRSGANTGNPTTTPACTKTTDVTISDHAATACTMSGSVSNNTAADASSNHNTMPPFLAVYVWKRTG